MKYSYLLVFENEEQRRKFKEICYSMKKTLGERLNFLVNVDIGDQPERMNIFRDNKADDKINSDDFNIKLEKARERKRINEILKNEKEQKDTAEKRAYFAADIEKIEKEQGYEAAEKMRAWVNGKY